MGSIRNHEPVSTSHLEKHCHEFGCLYKNFQDKQSLKEAESRKSQNSGTKLGTKTLIKSLQSYSNESSSRVSPSIPIISQTCRSSEIHTGIEES